MGYKTWLDCHVLGQLYWWADESPENIQEIRALAMQNSIEGETRLEMSFWAKVHFSFTLILERADLLMLEYAAGFLILE